MSKITVEIQREIDVIQKQYANGLVSYKEKLISMIALTNNMLGESGYANQYLTDGSDMSDYNKALLITERLIFEDKVKDALCFYLTV